MNMNVIVNVNVNIERNKRTYETNQPTNDRPTDQTNGTKKQK